MESVTHSRRVSAPTACICIDVAASCGSPFDANMLTYVHASWLQVWIGVCLCKQVTVKKSHVRHTSTENVGVIIGLKAYIGIFLGVRRVQVLGLGQKLANGYLLSIIA